MRFESVGSTTRGPQNGSVLLHAPLPEGGDTALVPGSARHFEIGHPSFGPADADWFTQGLADFEESPTPNGDTIRHLTGLEDGAYDSKAAYILSAAAAWSYSDADTLRRMLHRRGLATPLCQSVHFANDALFVNTTAYVIKSTDRKLAILCFRGTEPVNVINWLSNTSSQMDPFRSAGYVHGGFNRTILALWPMIKYALVSPKANLSELEALYITGHSLGGSLAVLAAALLFSDYGDYGDSVRYQDLLTLRSKLRGVYTFGQPMVGDAAFSERFDRIFGEKYFRHVYAQDVVPRLPARTMGRFTHFGREYTSTSGGWLRQSQPMVQQVFTLTMSTLVGGLAWARDQLPVLSWLRLPFSWGDHAPLNYLRTSQATCPGSEFE